MMKFRIQMMTKKDYCNFLGGSNNYYIETVWIDAETAEEAYEIATKNYPIMAIDKAVKSEKEIETEEKIIEEERQKEEEKEKAKKEKAKKQAEEKATEQGLTIEKYEELKKAKTNRRRYERQIETAKAEIEKLLKNIKYYEKKKEYYDEIIKALEK